jgi:hypothetical protein
MTFTTKLIGLATAAVIGVAVFEIVAPDQEDAVVILPAQAQPAHPGATSVAAAGVMLHSDRFDLPTGERMFPGADADAINNNCLACHSAGMVLTQPALTRSAWQSEVEKMRAQFKAPVAEEDVPAIVAYLASHKGAP